jgi:protein-S-isoprenylcysteine O-methyltransferase Ste14
MPEKNLLIGIGDFFFKWRNLAFPVIFAVLFVLFPPPAEYLGAVWIEEAKDIIAVLIIVAGLAFRSATIGWAYIKRGGLNKQVYADKLVTGGFFGLCRNPLYVGNMLLFSGIFVMNGQPLAMLFGIGFHYLIYASIIAAEEHYLRNRFGAEYAGYCARVPRWIPDFTRYKESIEGMSFSFARAIAKDYTTIFNACLAMAAVEMIEHYLYYPWATFVQVSEISAVVFLILLIPLLTIKSIKRSGGLRS